MATDKEQTIADVHAALETLRIPQGLWTDLVFWERLMDQPVLDEHGRPLDIFRGMNIEVFGRPTTDPPDDDPDEKFFKYESAEPVVTLGGIVVVTAALEMRGMLVTSPQRNVRGLRFFPPDEPPSFGLLWPGNGVSQKEINDVRMALRLLGRVTNPGSSGHRPTGSTTLTPAEFRESYAHEWNKYFDLNGELPTNEDLIAWMPIGRSTFYAHLKRDPQIEQELKAAGLIRTFLDG